MTDLAERLRNLADWHGPEAAALMKEAADEIERLRAALAEAEEGVKAQNGVVVGFAQRVNAAEAKLSKAVEALEPFATFASAPTFDRLPKEMPMTMGSGFARKQVTVGDFLNALATLKEIGGGDD